jgi:hypothetical protein
LINSHSLNYLLLFLRGININELCINASMFLPMISLPSKIKNCKSPFLSMIPLKSKIVNHQTRQSMADRDPCS